MAILQPHIQASSKQRARGRVVLGTVSGDLHDLFFSLGFVFVFYTAVSGLRSAVIYFIHIFNLVFIS